MNLDLEKRAQKLTLSLEKKGILSIRARVATAYDRSGSMDPLYENGVMQEYTNRMIPLGMRFDDNATIDNWAFHNDVFPLGPITVDNVATFVKDEIEPITSRGTSFAPVLRSITEHYFGTPEKPVPTRPATPAVTKKKGFFASLFGSKTVEPEITPSVAPEPVSVPNAPEVEDPVYLIFQTDGVNDDKQATDKLLGYLESKDIYIQFVGIGDVSQFEFIQKMGDKYNNVGFMHVADLAKTSDGALYDMLINDEFKSFLKTRFPNNIKEI